MNKRTFLITQIIFIVAIAGVSLWANPLEPDEIILKNKDVLSGLIVKSNTQSVTLQTDRGEQQIPRSEILRIRQNSLEEALYTKVCAPGTLPDWRVIVNDLRLQDDIRKFDQVPATTITEGVFKNVPYMSFRINDFFEMNIYGDPDDPAGIEVGIYGVRRGSPMLQKHIRDFLASYLTEIPQLNAIYALDPKGETQKVGAMVIETTPPSAPDADGGWWLSIYNENSIKNARLSDKEYHRLTLPREEVLLPNGRLNPLAWAEEELKDIRRHVSSDRVLVRGFTRDKHGRFQLH